MLITRKRPHPNLLLNYAFTVFHSSTFSLPQNYCTRAYSSLRNDRLKIWIQGLGALVAPVLADGLLRTKIRSRSRLPLAPGPPGHWLFGNAPPRAKTTLGFAHCAQTDIVYVCF